MSGSNRSPSRFERSPSLTRSSESVFGDLMARRSGYVPDWTAESDDPGTAIVVAEAAMASSLWERLDNLPDKLKLTFLTALGIDALPPAAARAPIAFEPLPSASGGTGRPMQAIVVPSGSSVGAAGADGNQIAFRTEHSLGINPSPLVEVHSVDPGADATANHSVEVMGQRPIRPFTNLTQIRRYLYLSHDQLLAIKGNATISVEFVLAQDSRLPLELVWSIWNGETWREFGADDVVDQTRDGDDTAAGALGRSGTITLTSHCIEAAPTKVNGIKSHWLRAELRSRLGFTERMSLPRIDQIRLAVELGSPSEPAQIDVTKAIADGSEADLTMPFQPFGPAPDRRSILHVDAADVVSAGTERVELLFDTITVGPVPIIDPTLTLEYWNGREWAQTTSLAPPANGSTKVGFDVPSDWVASEIDGQPGTWARLRIASGTYTANKPIDVGGGAGATIEVAAPPFFQAVRFELYGRSAATSAESVLSFDGARFQDHTAKSQWQGSPFTPFAALSDQSPALYFGFDGPIPSGQLGVLFEVAAPTGGETGRAAHEFRWEHFDGFNWRGLPVDDETDHLTNTGLARPTWPGNRRLRRIGPATASEQVITVADQRDAARFLPGEEVYIRGGDGGELATIASITGRTISTTRALEGSYRNAIVEEPEPPLFGRPLTWIRARLEIGSPLPTMEIRRITTNVAWASQSRPVNRELIGSGNSRPNQRLFSTNAPLLPDMTVEVRELTGARARTDYAILQRELSGTPHELDIETDADGDPVAVWVRWSIEPNLASSGPQARHCTVDLARGVFIFGNDVHARSVPTGPQNVRITGNSGGGAGGNVPIDAITSPLSGMLVAGLTNLAAASGGAEAETGIRAGRRAPAVVRHRYQAVTTADFSSLAIEASPEVFDATLVPKTDDLGGTLAVHVVADSSANPPAPSAQLLDKVRRHLLLRCSPGALSGLSVTEPVFIPVGLDISLAVVNGGETTDGSPLDRITKALADYLHPVTGNDGNGWGFGSIIHPVRFALLLEGLDDVDFVESFIVTIDGVVEGTSRQLGPAELPVSGPLTLSLVQPEER